MCLFDSATCWRIGRRRCSPDTRSTVLWSAWIPTSGWSGPPWWPGGKSEDRVTASAEAVRSVLTGRPSRSLSRVTSRIRLPSVSSMNCTSGSMSSANRTGLCMVSLLRSPERASRLESYRGARLCASVSCTPRATLTSPTAERSFAAMDPAEIDVPHAVVRVLEEAGIQFVFGMPGGDTGRIFDALYDSTRIKTILVRHEQVGSIMAEMYGRLTGKPGVVMGQGIFLACNALFGTLEAVKGASPMLLLADFTDMAPFQHHAPYQAGTGEHGDHDLRNLLASATKYTAAVYEPKQAMQTIQLAIKHATTGTPGPVAVVFGSRSLQGTVKTKRPPRVHATDRVLAPNVLRPAAADVAHVAEMLLASSSPVILAGNGVHASRAWSELTALADLLAIPVATTATGKSAIADVHPQALGVFGNWGQAVANEVVSTADTVLVVGSRLAPTDTCFENPELLDADRQTFLQVDVEPLNVGRHFPVAAAIVADAREALAALVAELRPRVTSAQRDTTRRRAAHLAELKTLHRYFAQPEQRLDDVPLPPERLITELARRLDERALVTMDAGANRLYMTHYFQSSGAGTVYRS